MYKLALERIAEAQKNGAATLNLSHCELSELPEALFEFQELEYLDISNNKFAGNSLIPLAQFPNLVELNAFNNQITDIRILQNLNQLRQF